MRVNLEWLRDWVELGDVERVAADLTTSGLEVDSLERLAAIDRNIVVAEVLSVERHPNADKLSVCVVDDGAAQQRVVCGAPNVAAGIKAPFARVGAKLPSGKAIGAAELRGVQSNGMLCSAKELELADDVDGLLILDADAPKGASVAEYLRLDDAVLEINVTPNRGDCFSVIGIARELAARRSARLAPPKAPPVAATIDATFPISLGAGGGCPRFAGRVAARPVAQRAHADLDARAVAARRAPAAATDRRRHELRDARARPADARLRPRQARRAHRGAARARRREAHACSTAASVELTGDMLVIADARGPVGLAGVMGGQATAVSASTDSVFLESAFFAPAAIVGRPRRLGLHTDASLRFERGVDPTGQVRAVERATRAVARDLRRRTPARSRTSSAPPSCRERRPWPCGAARLRAVLGIEVPAKQVAEIFERLEMKVERTKEGWRVTPPAFRFDVAIEEDLIEEIGRMFGYDAIPATPGEAVERLGAASEHVVEPDDVADLLAARGYAEAITYSFIDAGLRRSREPRRTARRAREPDRERLAVLRRSLWPGLIDAARLNVSQQRQRVRLFELGPQFAAAEPGVAQTPVAAGLALGTRAAEHWDGAGPDVDYFDVKGDVEALLRLTGAPEEFRFEAGAHPALSPGRTARILRARPPRRLARRAASRARETNRQETHGRRVRAAARRVDAGRGARVPALLEVSVDPPRPRDRRRRRRQRRCFDKSRARCGAAKSCRTCVCSTYTAAKG